MHFSPGPREDVEDLLGEWARRLEARAEVVLAERGGEPRCVSFVLAAGVLEDAERRLLAGAGGARLGPGPGGLERLEIAPAELQALGSRSRAARCLAATLGAATSAPGATRLMGIVNTTPDSFSDGGAFLDAGRAIEHGLRLIDEGADLVDVGGESTRPGASPVPLAVELERVLPVVSALARDGRALVSIDTTKAEVARAALEAGARVVNDVSAGRNDARMLALVAERGAGLVLMHSRGSPRDMQDRPHYADVVREVVHELRSAAHAAWSAGVEPARIALDPGLGFGKLLEHNLELMRALPELRSLGFPLCLGLSRKSFLGRLSGATEPARRGSETSAGVALAAFLGVEIHRVHEVASARAAVSVATALARRERGR